MADRKPISKKTRFEVFKRDSFTCQYCGRKAPDVVLECDHIKPVSKGGSNDITNLVTSCVECNRGKSDRELSDDSAVAVKRKQLEEIQERREQLELMALWEDELTVESLSETTIIKNNVIGHYTDFKLSDEQDIELRSLIKRFGLHEVCESMRIAFSQYDITTRDRFDNAFTKVGGIAYMRTHKTCRSCVNFSQANRSYVYCKKDLYRGWDGTKFAESCEGYKGRF